MLPLSSGSPSGAIEEKKLVVIGFRHRCELRFFSLTIVSEYDRRDRERRQREFLDGH